MICTRCLTRPALRRLARPAIRPLSSCTPRHVPAQPAAVPPLSTPVTDAAPAGSAALPAQPAPPLSSCLEGTVLVGLNFVKGKEDPVALADDQYPAWLWRCLDKPEQADAADELSAVGEYSKSKKERRSAVKKARAREEALIAAGNIEALAPKVPLQHQSVNMPGTPAGDAANALEAAQSREVLRRAMRKERAAKIRENNYLSTL